MLKGLLFNKPATVRSNLKALSATGLQTLQSSTQRGHCLLSASVRPTVGTDGASPGRSSHSYHSKCGDPVGSCLTITMCRSPTYSAGSVASQPYLISGTNWGARATSSFSSRARRARLIGHHHLSPGLLRLFGGAFQFRHARLDVLDLDGLGPVRQHQIGGPKLRGRLGGLVHHDFEHGGNRGTR